MGDVVDLNTMTKADIPPETILENAPKDFDSLVLIGVRDGNIQVFTSAASIEHNLLLVEVAKREFMDYIVGADPGLPEEMG